MSSSQHSLPHFSFYDQPDCDLDGNMFFHLNSGLYNRSVILKLSRTAEKSTVFKFSDEYTDNTAFYAFTVTPMGTVRILAQDKDGFYVFDFDSDAKMTGRTRLAMPDNTYVSHFAALDNGIALVSGYFNKDAATNKSGNSFIAVFDASGRQLGEVKYSHKYDLAESNLTIQQGSAVPGKDGNFYLLLADRILVVSAAGSVERIVPFEPINPQALALKLFVSDGTFGIVLRIRKPNGVETDFLVLDASTGERIGFYTFPEKASGHVLCYSRKEGLTSFAYENKMFTLVNSPLK